MWYVDGENPAAADTNPGTEQMPWKTLTRAGTATEVQPADTVLIKTGVYREAFHINISGEPGMPITFAAAPGAVVEVKGSEIIDTAWTKVTGGGSEPPEPYPGAFDNLWKTILTERFFEDADFAGSYAEADEWWVSQVFQNNRRAFQLIGPDAIYQNDSGFRLTQIGRDVDDTFFGSFFFDPTQRALYLSLTGEPTWVVLEMGVRGWTLLVRPDPVDIVDNVCSARLHDVVVRGLHFSQNRQPGGQWPMARVSCSERVVLEDCSFRQADFAGLGIERCKDCVLRDSDASYNGNTGLGLSYTEDVVVERTTFLANNYRHFNPNWHAGGIKAIPGNVRAKVSGCTVGQNRGQGIWFDDGNVDTMILDNVVHNNHGPGIMVEINVDGGIVAGNLVFGNWDRGIYVSGSQNTWVVNNTVVENQSGITVMPRGVDWPIHNVHIRNNLLIRNFQLAPGFQRGADLTLYMGVDATGERTVFDNSSDFNVFADNTHVPHARHSWNPDNTLPEWQNRFSEDLNSLVGRVEYFISHDSLEICPTAILDNAGPLPADVSVWQPLHPHRVGSNITRFP